MPQSDPWEEAAKAYKASGAPASGSATPASGSDDWKVWNQGADGSPSADQGFFSSALQSSGLPAMAHAAMHPIDTIKTLPGSIKMGIANEGQALSNLKNDYQKTGFSPQTRHDIADATPVFGSVLKQAQAQHDAGNDAGMAGTVAGFVGGSVAPEAGIKMAGSALKGAGRVAEFAGASPEARRVAMTRAIVPGTPTDLLNRAVRPPVSYGDFENDLKTVEPDIKSNSAKFGGLEGLGNTLKQVKGDTNKWYQDNFDPYRNFQVNASPIADAQMSSIPITEKIEQPPKFVAGSPGRMKTVNVPSGEGGKMSMGGYVGSTPDALEGGIMQKTAAKANNFRQDMPLGVVDDVRKDTNAKLQGIWNKSGGDRYAALSEPENARMFATNNAARDLTYDNFSRMSAGGRTDGGIPVDNISENQKLYGAANNLDDVVNKRGIVFGRQNPMSLPESMALSGGKGIAGKLQDFAVQRMAKTLTNPDSLTNAAIDRMRAPDFPSLDSGESIPSRVMSNAGRGVRQAGDATSRFASQPGAATLRGSPLLYWGDPKRNP